MTPKILSFGEIIWDVYENGRALGGAPLNFAAHAAKCGAKSFLLSAVGGDEPGGAALRAAGAHGIDVRYVQSVGFPTGRCEVTLDARGVPAYHISENAAFDHIPLPEKTLADILAQKFDALYFGTLAQRASVSRQTLGALCRACAFRQIVCDVNLRRDGYDRASAEFCLSHATLLKCSAEEEPLLRALGLYTVKGDSYQEIARAVTAAFPQICVFLMTLGEKGAYLYLPADGRGILSPAKPAKVVSTVGAGDSFTAAFCVSCLSGESVEIALEKAAALAAHVVSRKEAVPD